MIACECILLGERKRVFDANECGCYQDALDDRLDQKRFPFLTGGARARGEMPAT